MVAPGVVGIGQNLYAVRIIDSNDVSLEVLLEVEGVKGVGSVRGISILHPDGGAGFVIQIDQEVVIPSLADDLRAVQRVDVLHVVDSRACADSVGIVEEFQRRARLGHLLQLPSVPGRGVAVEGFGIADGIVGNGGRANLGQLVAHPAPAEHLALRVADYLKTSEYFRWDTSMISVHIVL